MTPDRSGIVNTTKMEKVPNPFAGTLLENVYTPIILSYIGAPAVSTTVPLLTDSSSEMVRGGFASHAISIPGVTLTFADCINPLTESLKLVDTLWERLFKKKEYKKVVSAYNNLIVSINQEFKAYTSLHENCLKRSQRAIDNINRQKTLMKDYLLHDLFDLLSFSGKAGSFTELEFDQLDLRRWPVNEKYNLIKERNLELINILREDDVLDLMSSLLIPGAPALNLPVLLYTSIKNRLLVKRVKKTIAELEPIAQANQSDMEADLCQLDTFALSLENISKVYKSILEEIRPIMKKVLTDIEFKYSRDFTRLPEEIKMALFKMKEILKELAEKSILPKDSKNEDSISAVCRYSNDISIRFIELKNMLKNNFAPSLTTA